MAWRKGDPKYVLSQPFHPRQLQRPPDGECNDPQSHIGNNGQILFHQLLMEDPRNGGTEEHSGHDVAAHPRGFQRVGDLSAHIATEK